MSPPDSATTSTSRLALCVVFSFLFFFSLRFLQKLHHFGVSAVHLHSHTVLCFNSVFMLSAPSPLFFSFHLSSYILLPCRPSRLPRLFLPVVTVRQSESVCQKICLCGLRILCIYIFDIFYIIYFLNVNFVLKNMCRFAGLTLSTHIVSLQPPKSKTKCF